MICFGVLYIKLSQPHDSRIVLNGLTQVDLALFLCHFLISIFINFIVQHWVQYV
jgi:hypothetical protein